jgi:hypothetical protein
LRRVDLKNPVINLPVNVRLPASYPSTLKIWISTFCHLLIPWPLWLKMSIIRAMIIGGKLYDIAICFLYIERKIVLFTFNVVKSSYSQFYQGFKCVLS